MQPLKRLRTCLVRARRITGSFAKNPAVLLEHLEPARTGLAVFSIGKAAADEGWEILFMVMDRPLENTGVTIGAGRNCIIHP